MRAHRISANHQHEGGTMFEKRRARKRFERDIADKSPWDKAMRRMRWTAHNGGSQREMLALAEEALREARSGEERQQALTWLEPLRAGRTVKTTSAPMTLLSWAGVDARSIDEIEEALRGVEER
jgi:hypothetical protein